LQVGARREETLRLRVGARREETLRLQVGARREEVRSGMTKMVPLGLAMLSDFVMRCVVSLTKCLQEKEIFGKVAFLQHGSLGKKRELWAFLEHEGLRKKWDESLQHNTITHRSGRPRRNKSYVGWAAII
jgi:hypothetical protein